MGARREEKTWEVKFLSLLVLVYTDFLFQIILYNSDIELLHYFNFFLRMFLNIYARRSQVKTKNEGKLSVVVEFIQDSSRMEQQLGM